MEQLNLHLVSSYFNQECEKVVDSNVELSLLFLRTMLVRKYYGGMSCDITMINKYVLQWMHRFQNDNNSVLIDIINAYDHDKHVIDKDSVLSWSSVPFIVYKDTILKSNESCMQEIISNGILSLSINDVCYAGIDFHCSSILEDIASNNPTVFHSIIDLLQRGTHPTTTLSSSSSKQRDACLRVLKKCMWEYSSGINHRKFLNDISTTNDNYDNQGVIQVLDDGEVNYKIWQLIDPLVDAYAVKYLRSRLARI